MTRKVQEAIAKFTYTVVLVGLCFVSIGNAFASSRIKDIVSVEGVRDNQLVGYGLVVGLNGTGDTLQNTPYTQQSLEAMLERLGVNSRNTQIKAKNIAAVMITASLPAFSRIGTNIDVIVSSIGDAKDLRGGSLLVTPLFSADGEVYAVAQGSIAVAGFSAGGEAATITQGVPTAGRISNGAIVEKEIDFELADLKSIRLSLKNPDFTTSKRIADAINGHLGSPIAISMDPSTVLLTRPIGSTIAMVDLITSIEQLLVVPDQPAKVIIDDRSGIIVMGSMVKVNTIAIAQGNLTIRVTENPEVVQPNAFGGGETAVEDNTTIEVDTASDRRLTVMSEGVTLQDLVDGLNALGVGPRDMISILQAIKAAGAMQADIEVM